MSDTFSVRLPAEQAKFLDKLARETDRSRNKLISEAVGRMQQNYEFVMQRLAEGDKDYAEGRILSHDEVVRRSDVTLGRLGKN
jgi:predicted transcriptional regulator